MPRSFNWENGAEAMGNCKTMKLHYFTPYVKIKSKLNNNLNISTQTIKHLDKNIGENLNDSGFDNG